MNKDDKLEKRGPEKAFQYDEDLGGVPAHTDRVEVARAEKQVEAMVIMAKRFPRDTEKVKGEVVRLCANPDFAEEALYTYERGGKTVLGPSIRLAEVVAQNWGNMLFGVQEVGRRVESSDVRAYCWDLEKNLWAERVFVVPHIRYTKEKGNTPLYDPRDIYETVANQGARRLRACILSHIPADIQKDLVEVCTETQKKQAKTEESKKTVVKKMVDAFAALKPAVSRKDLEERLGHSLDEITPDEKVEITGIYAALKDGIKKKADYFGGKGWSDRPGADPGVNVSAGTVRDPAGPADGLQDQKRDADRTDSDLRVMLLELMAKHGKDKDWLKDLFGVPSGVVKVETIPRQFLLEAIQAIRLLEMDGGEEGGGAQE
jgi:hypothetical protein